MAVRRIPFMFLALIALISGILGGVWRAGWWLPDPIVSPILLHGPLMVCGFLGTVIGLERAVAGQKAWMYGAPLFAGLSTFFLLSPLPNVIGIILIVLSSAVLTGIFGYFTVKFPSLHMRIMALAAIAWLVGNVLWLIGFEINQIVLWWTGFIILTIAGERLDLTKYLKITPNVRRAFLVAIGFLTAGMLATLLKTPDHAMRISGLGMVLLALWLLRFDIARRSIKKNGLTRFIGVALMSGYVWLAVGGLFAVIWSDAAIGFHYDAIVHAIFVGFAFSMIFGHAPVIFPGVLGVVMPFQRFFYSHLVMLHLSLIVRIAGDLLILPQVRLVGAMLNGLAIVMFFLNTIVTVIFAKR